MFDLLIPLAFFALASLVGAWLRGRRKDPCLKSFEDYHVTLVRTNQQTIWGVLELSPTGLELRYRALVQDERHVESSYVLYGNEYGDIEAIFRFADDLDAKSSKRRQNDVARSLHPSPLRLFWRRLRNFTGEASESLNDAMGMVIGRMKRPGGRYITDSSEGYLKQLSSNVIGSVGLAHEALLERFIGQKVVAEVVEHGVVHEHVGIFKSYSADFLELLDVQYPFLKTQVIAAGAQRQSDVVQAEFKDGILHIQNSRENPVLVISLETPGAIKEEFNVVLEPGQTIELYPQAALTTAQLHLRVIRTLDFVIPRTRCVIRHRAENYDQNSLLDVIFDVGILMGENEHDREREATLRQRLDQNPSDAPAAAQLGHLLLQKQELHEAEKWMRLALQFPDSLPDNGRRVRMELRELERRRLDIRQGLERPSPDGRTPNSPEL